MLFLATYKNAQDIVTVRWTTIDEKAADWFV
jgi:hypothetical protein